MLALAGTIQGNRIVVESDDIEKYNGRSVILTILERDTLVRLADEGQLMPYKHNGLKANLKAR